MVLSIAGHTLGKIAEIVWESVVTVNYLAHAIIRLAGFANAAAARRFLATNPLFARDAVVFASSRLCGSLDELYGFNG